MGVPPKIRTTLKSVNHLVIPRKRRFTLATTIVVIEIIVNIILNKDASMVVFRRAGAELRDLSWAPGAALGAHSQPGLAAGADDGKLAFC
jgi:hypothetical protein